MGRQLERHGRPAYSAGLSRAFRPAYPRLTPGRPGARAFVVVFTFTANDALQYWPGGTTPRNPPMA